MVKISGYIKIRKINVSIIKKTKKNQPSKTALEKIEAAKLLTKNSNIYSTNPKPEDEQNIHEVYDNEEELNNITFAILRRR